MAGQKGRDILVEIAQGDPPQTFIAVAGLRARSISFNARLVDGTSADSANAWRELIAGAGVKSARVAGAGIFRDENSDAALREAFFAGAAVALRLTIPSFVRLTGSFAIESLDYAGAHDGEATFTIDLASAGAIEAETI